jgi:hypothetical protein
MAAMGDHDLVTVAIGLEGGTDLLSDRLTHGLLHGSAGLAGAKSVQWDDA